MSDTLEHIEAKMRINREIEKKEKKKVKKPDYLGENLRVLNELSYLVHENTDKRFHEIYESYIESLKENED